MAAVIPVGAEGTSLPCGTSPVEGTEEGFAAGGTGEFKEAGTRKNKMVQTLFDGLVMFRE